MKVELLYGRGHIEVELPDDNLMQVLNKPYLPPLADSGAAMEEGLTHPIGAQPLSRIAQGKRNAVVTISDITRPVPNKVIMPPILRTLEAAGIPRDQVTILVATGIHRPATDAELLEMLGEDIVANYRIVSHDARKEDEQAYVGDTERGTPIWIDRLYIEADLKVVTGLIEPHFMAGFSGGRKGICPGLVGIPTVARQHGPVYLEDPKAASGSLEGNPFHEEATEVALGAGCDFLVNAVINEKREVVGLFCGDLIEAHKAGVELCKQIVRVEVEEPVDIVVTSAAGYPLDSNYYQTVKGMVEASRLLKPGGILVVASKCTDGLGSEEFQSELGKASCLKSYVKSLCEPGYFVVDQWEVEMLAKALNGAEAYIYTEVLCQDDCMLGHIQLVSSVEEGVAKAIAKLGAKAKLIAIPEGPYVMGVLRSK